MGRKDILVVGGGTIGSFYAMIMSKGGFDIHVFEENKEIGVPQHCSGLVSIDGLKRIGVWDYLEKSGIILNRIRVAKFVSIRGTIRKIELPNYTAVVLDRIKYDKMLADKAISNGAHYHLNAKVKKISRSGFIEVKINGKNEKFFGDIIVDAEGASRNLIKHLPGVHKKGLLPSLQLDVLAHKWILPSDSVELHFNVDDFFSWIIPISDEKPIYRVGVATKTLSINYKKFLIDFAKKKLGKIRILNKFGGIVVSGGPIKRFVWDKIIAIGDAAGHVKPTTGGGLLYGYICATLAGAFLAIGRPDLYEKTCKRLVHNTLMRMKNVRSILNILPDPVLSLVISAIQSPYVIGDVMAGDQDVQTDIVLRILKNPFFYAGLTPLRRLLTA